MGGLGSGQHNNHRTTYLVVELCDPTDRSLPRFVAAQRRGESPWHAVWQNRAKLRGRLATWFREIASQGREPMERVLLGRGVGLTMKTALALANFRIAEINRMATGDEKQMADFLCVEPICRGGRGHRRPIVVVGPNGEQTEYPSISAMARAEHISRATAARRVRRGLSRQIERITL